MSVQSAELQRDENRQKILQAVIRLYSDNKPVTLDTIAKTAGVTKRTVHYIFETRLNLIIIAANSLLEGFFAHIRAIIKSNNFQNLSGLEQVMKIQHQRAVYYQNNPSLARLISEINQTSPESKSENDNMEIYVDLVSHISGLFTLPLQKGSADGSIRPEISPSELNAVLFFSFGVSCQTLSTVYSNKILGKIIPAKEIITNLMEQTRYFLQTQAK